MNELFLSASESNWGLKGPGDMVKQSWKVYRDGRFSYRASCLPVDDKVVPDQCAEGVVEPEDLRRLVEAADEPWPSDLVEACDGSAWEFSVFGAGRKVVKHRRHGYIYGLEVFERIASVLWGLLEDPSTDHPGEEDG